MAHQADQYLTIAIQYYVAGRTALIAHLGPVCGNILHHAAEMLLKFFLLKSHTPEELRDQFGHDLKKLWRAPKQQQKDAALARFDTTISTLNLIEDLRYPGNYGYVLMMDLQKGPRHYAKGPAVKGMTQHYVNLEDIDEFFTTLLSGRVTPEWVRGLLLKPEAKSQYADQNKHPFF
ncbi:MAG TPA: hypothetical protein VIF14_12135 [Alphaproteobacteria bacterium]|jgi:hypothetical protein